MTETDTSTPGAVAQLFLTALDAQAWSRAAALVHPQTAQRVRSQHLSLIRLRGTPTQVREPQPASDFELLDPEEFLRVDSAAQAEQLSALDWLARTAQALDPGIRAHHAATLQGIEPSADSLPRLQRTVLEAKQRGRIATVHYRTDWFTGETPRPHLGGEHELRLRHTEEGWRVSEVDLTGRGRGRLVLSGLEMLWLRTMFWFTERLLVRRRPSN
jgi:hypothetical protein